MPRSLTADHSLNVLLFNLRTDGVGGNCGKFPTTLRKNQQRTQLWLGSCQTSDTGPGGGQKPKQAGIILLRLVLVEAAWVRQLNCCTLSARSDSSSCDPKQGNS
jgi:hypothetical protein